MLPYSSHFIEAGFKRPQQRIEKKKKTFRTEERLISRKRKKEKKRFRGFHGRKNSLGSIKLSLWRAAYHRGILRTVTVDEKVGRNLKGYIFTALQPRFLHRVGASRESAGGELDYDDRHICISSRYLNRRRHNYDSFRFLSPVIPQERSSSSMPKTV